MRSLLLALLAVAALVAAGCGGDDPSTPEDTVSTAVKALAKGDGKTVCEQFTPGARSTTLVELRKGPVGLPKIKATTCPEAIGKIYAVMPRIIRNTLADGKVDKARIKGDTAKVHVTSASVTADLQKIDGTWRITGGLFG